MSRKPGNLILVHNFGKLMLTDFQNSFTVELGSVCVTSWSLKIPPHLTHIATLPENVSLSVYC